VNLYSAKGQ